MMLEKIRKFFEQEDGVTAIEYGLIAALMAIVIIVAVALTGQNLSANFYDKIANSIIAATTR